MPFYELDFKSEIILDTDETNKIITPMPSPERVPIFLIPSLGNGGDLFPLAWEIKQSHPTRPIYAYFDPLLVNDSEENVTSLQEKAVSIAKDIELSLSNRFHPIVIISDTYGCGIAFLVAEYFKENHSFLCLINGKTANHAKHQLLDQDESEQTILRWEIIERIARSCQLDMLELNPDMVPIFSKVPLENRLDDMAKKLIAFHKANYKAENVQNFEKNIQTANHYLRLICNYQTENQPKKHPMSLDEEDEKWLSYLSENNIKYAEFSKLLENNLAHLSKKIMKFIASRITEKYLEKYFLPKQWMQVANALEEYAQGNLENNSAITEAITLLYEAAQKFSLTDSPTISSDEINIRSKQTVRSHSSDAAFFRRKCSLPILKTPEPQKATRKIKAYA
jgi:hypothetical protein